MTASTGNGGRHRVPKGETALAEGAPQAGDWAAVDLAVTERMVEFRMSISYLARETGLSPTTIRYLGSPAGKHNRSTLVALSVVLGWPYKYLVNIVNGEPEKNVASPGDPARPGDSARETYYENLLRAEVGPVREEVAGLAAAVNGIGQQLDAVFRDLRGRPASSGADGDAGGHGRPAS